MAEFLCHQGYTARNQERDVNAFPHLHPAVLYGRKTINRSKLPFCLHCVVLAYHPPAPVGAEADATPLCS